MSNVNLFQYKLYLSLHKVVIRCLCTGYVVSITVKQTLDGAIKIKLYLFVWMVVNSVPALMAAAGGAGHKKRKTISAGYCDGGFRGLILK